MKIVYISKYLDVPSDSETGSRGFHLCRELTNKGHEVTILTTKPPYLFEQHKLHDIFTTDYHDKVKVVYLRTINFSNRKSIARILSWIEFELKVLFYITWNRLAFEIVVASSLSILSIISALILKKLRGCQVVFEVRDIWPLTLVEVGGYSKWNPLVLILGKVEKWGYKKSNLVVGTMPKLVDHVRNLNISRDGVECLPMGVSDEHIASTSVKHNHEFFNEVKDKAKNRRIIGYAGSFGNDNALEYIFETASRFQSDAALFVFVGDGNLKSRYIEKYGKLDNVLIGPNLSKKVVSTFLSSCDILIFATHPNKVWDYGQSLNKIVDYMLNAKPIFGIYNGYDDMVGMARCGEMSKSNNIDIVCDRLTELLNLSDADLVEMGERGQKWLLENRHYSTLGAKYEELLLKAHN